MSKPIECTPPPRGKPKELWTLGDYDVSVYVHCGTRCTILVSDVDSRGGSTCVGAEGIFILSQWLMLRVKLNLETRN